MAWFRPAEDVDAAALDVLDRVLEKPCHEYLREFGIRLMFRSDTPKNRGQETWATAKRASAFERALLPTTACYIIVSAPIWQVLREDQQEALLDHELRQRHFMRSSAAGRRRLTLSDGSPCRRLRDAVAHA